MKFSFPAVFKVDVEDERFINVVFPDIPGAVTFGEGMDDARRMAKDCLIAMEEYLSVTPASTLEETQNNFAEYLVEMVEVEV